MATGTGTCYAAWFTSATQVQIVRVIANNLSTYTVLQTELYSTTINTPYAIQLEWAVNQGPQNATWLAFSVGTALDFSDVMPRVTYSDNSASKISNGNYEGLAGLSTTSTLVTVDYDTVSLFSP
jgi:hypothetical protein